MHNLRHRIARLRLEGGELAKYGPSKRPDKQGIDTYEDATAAGGGGSEGGSSSSAASAAAAPRERGPHYCMDPTGRRTGEGARPTNAQHAPAVAPPCMYRYAMQLN